MAEGRTASPQTIGQSRGDCPPKQGTRTGGILPDSEGRLRQEIHLQTALGVTMMAAKGFAAPDVLQAFSKACILCEKLGDQNELFVALCGASLVPHDFRQSARR